MASGGTEPDLEFEFDHSLESPRRARHALRAMFSDPSDPISSDVELAASELVTNVVTHTTDGGSMRAWDPKPNVPIRLEVEDFDSRIPAAVDAPDVGGRGLTIVETVSDAWGVQPTEQGKVVWAEFNRPGADG